MCGSASYECFTHHDVVMASYHDLRCVQNLDQPQWVSDRALIGFEQVTIAVNVLTQLPCHEFCYHL